MGALSRALGVRATAPGRLTSRGAAGLVLLAAGCLAGCGWTAPGPGVAEACRRVAVVDAADPTAPPIRGIEDIAAVDDGLYLSAQDRRHALGDAPRGGLYWLDRDRLAEAHARRRVAVRDVTRHLPALERLLPHGISARPAEDGDEVLVIDRRPEGDEPGPALWRLLVTDGPDGRIARSAAQVARGPSLCNANDVLDVAPGRALLTRHLESCDRLHRLVELVTGRATGSVTALSWDGSEPATMRTVRDGLAFANGIALLDDPSPAHLVAVAASRDDRLWAIDPRTGGADPLRGPDGSPQVLSGLDNLTAASDGGLLAASHPDLLALFLHLEGIFDTAPSLIRHVAPGRTSRLLYASDGHRPLDSAFSGATVAVATGGWLVLGAALDTGLLICRLPAGDEGGPS